jgi:hypothetical protein
MADCGECINDHCEYDAYNGDWDCECCCEEADPRFFDGCGCYYDEQSDEAIECPYFKSCIPDDEEVPVALDTFDIMMKSMGFEVVRAKK